MASSDKSPLSIVSKSSKSKIIPTDMNISTTKANESKKPKREPFFGKFRFCIAILLGFNTFSYTSLRMNLSMGMVCMVNSTAIHLRESANDESSNGRNSSFNDHAHKIHLKNLAYAEECGDREIKTTIHRNLGYQGSIEWSASEQARLFAALFYGGFITIWFSGYLADRFGPKLLIGMAILDMSVCSLLSPVLVDLNYYAFFVARFLMGLGDVCAIGMTSFTLWTIFAANSPDESSWIGLKEKQMITASLTAGGSRRLKTGKVPWSKMARSLPLYAGIIGQNGIYSMLPFLSMIFSKILFSIVADQLRKRNKLTDTQSVKLSQAIANIGAATSAFCMAKFVTCGNPQLAIAGLLTW
uniref:Major facilitator superfamily (MFS) profile domain-containing protein n=1 Tax=Meloidogyne javanica TaxID=6303 RepID=A0A915MJW9_MELJA